jgi:hypothetical protein
VVPERNEHWGFHVKLHRTFAAAAAGLALAGASLAFSPASAAPTPVSLVVTGAGGLALSVPTVAPGSFVDLGTFGAGAVAAQSNSLGAITVTDTRTGILNNNWIASVSASDLVLDGDSANAAAVGKFIPAASLGYVTGTVTTPVAPTVPPVVVATLPSLALPLPVVTNVSLGANTVTWNPKLSVTILPNTVAGTYEGTVTHSIL